ncbi:MAG: PspC domain-containing protein [Bacteroidales bacterium]|nr:PspC domain-containing protein [Bacteroidales bacterium]
MEKSSGLYRSSKDNMIGGVACGIAAYAHIDPVIVRLIFVLLAIFGGSGVFIYVIMWIVLPLDNSTVNNDFNSENMEENTKKENGQKSQFQNHPRFKKKDEGSLIAGLILISLGVIFLIIRYFPRIDFGDLWPVLLIVAGVVLLRNAFVRNKQ